MTFKLVLFALLFYLFQLITASRVYELNERFLEIYPRDKRSWIVMFYAPWCHHCKNLEPIWSQVGQQLHNQDALLVGKVDCTRYTSIATHFSVKGFPTILFINSDQTIEYRGDRNKQDILDFALRMNGPSVRQTTCNEIESLRENHGVFFIHFGDNIIHQFTQIAKKYQNIDWFYHSIQLCDGFSSGIYVVKQNKIQFKFDDSNSNLDNWIKFNRFPQFAKINHGNLNLLIQSKKYLVIALLEEYKVRGKLASIQHEEFHDLMRSIAYSYETDNKFIFGWTSEIDTINSIAIKTFTSLPNLIIINSTNLQYFILEDELLSQNIINLLDEIKYESLNIKALGGDSFWYRFHRLFFDIFTSLVNMYIGNPILTLLIFGLPLTFLSIIIYVTCFSDILDAKDDEEDEPDKTHEKNE